MMEAKVDIVKDDGAQIIASNLHAELHVHHFCEAFQDFYGVDLEQWAVCASANNCWTSLKVARLFNLAHIGCGNHLLNIGVQE